MALVTSYFDAMRINEHQVALTPSDCASGSNTVGHRQPSARLSFCCTPLSLQQAFQYGRREGVRKVTELAPAVRQRTVVATAVADLQSLQVPFTAAIPMGNPYCSCTHRLMRLAAAITLENPYCSCMHVS